MKRWVKIIKNLFGTDIRLRKWCVKQAIKSGRTVPEYILQDADAYYQWIKGRSDKPNPDSGCKHGNDQAAPLRMRIFTSRRRDNLE